MQATTANAATSARAISRAISEDKRLTSSCPMSFANAPLLRFAETLGAMTKLVGVDAPLASTLP
jgi:hypothetical protein